MANWRVSTYYKKSCEEHELWTKDGQTIRRKIGWRWAGFFVETTDDNPRNLSLILSRAAMAKKIASTCMMRLVATLKTAN